MYYYRNAICVCICSHPPQVPTVNTTTVMLYNALAHDRTDVVEVAFVRTKGMTGWPTVYDYKGAILLAQLSPNDEVNPWQSTTPIYKDAVYFKATVC